MIMFIESSKDNKSYKKAQDRMELLPNYYKWIYSYFYQHIRGKTLEIGAGAGHFIPHYIKQVQYAYALDYNKKLLENIEKQFPSGKVAPICFDLKNNIENLNLGSFDTVIALDVLEHMEDDVAMILQLKNILRNNGCLLLKVPAQNRLFGDTDRASGHYCRYELMEIRKMMREAKMEEVSLKHINSIGAVAYRNRRNSQTNFSRTFKPGSMKMINMAIPAIKFIDDLIPGKGLSIIGIYKKRNS